VRTGGSENSALKKMAESSRSSESASMGDPSLSTPGRPSKHSRTRGQVNRWPRPSGRAGRTREQMRFPGDAV
jgi:hypothetical protein